MNVPLCCPDITELEVAYVTRVLRSGQLSLGPRVQEFERKFAAYVGAQHAIAVNSGTSALHLAVRALGIGKGDEVITTSFSFVASSSCVLYEGAIPVFVDIDPRTLNIDIGKIEEFIRECCVVDANTGELIDAVTGCTVKAILPVHVFGLPCEMTLLLELARKYKLHVIEDACEALGATYNGDQVGTLGDVGVFAFYPNKQMTTGEGGMIVTNDERIALLCRSMRNQGRAAQSEWLEHVRLGYNYRLSDIHSALGLAQLERIEELLAGRARVAALYQHALGGHPLTTLPPSVAGCGRSWFVYAIQLPPLAGESGSSLRDRVLTELRARGIACQSYFPAIHLQPFFRESHLTQPRPLPATETASNTSLALPMFSSATEDQINSVCTALLEILDRESLSGSGRSSHQHGLNVDAA